MAMTAGEEATPEAAPGRPGRVGWRRILFILAAAAAVFIVAEHAMGGRLSLWVLIGIAVAALLLFGVIRYPHWQRHFHPFGKRDKGQRRISFTRTRTSRSGGGLGRKGGSGLHMPKLGGKGRSGPGSGSKGSGRSRGSGLHMPKLGGKGKTGTGSKGTGARRSGILGKRRGGANAGSRGGSGPKRRGPGLRPGKGRSSSGARGPGGSGRRAGIFRRKGGSGPGSRGGARVSKRNPFRPSAWRKNKAAGSARRTGAGRGGAVPKRRLLHPATWRKHKPGTTVGTGRHPGAAPAAGKTGWRHRQMMKRRAASTAALTGARPAAARKTRRGPAWMYRARPHGATGAPAGSAGAGGRNHPLLRRRLLRPSTWRTPENAAQQARMIRRQRRGALARPNFARRGLYKAIGTPQQRHNRMAAARALRARRRAMRVRRAATPYAHQARWYAPWRIWTRGAGARAQFGRWRATRGAWVPRDASGNKLGVRARIARRWNIARGRHKGLGLGQQKLGLRGRLSRMPAATARHAGRVRSGFARWRRNRPPPRPLLSGRHRIGAVNSAGLQRFRASRLGQRIARLDRRRTDRWTARHNRYTSAAVRRPGAPEPAGARRNGAAPGAHRITTRGGPVANVADAADQIRDVINQWMDANDLDQTLEDLHEIPRAIQDAFHTYSEKLREDTNLKEAIPEAISEASSSMQGIADSLQQAIEYGVQRN